MVDRDRILAKVDELDGYLEEASVLSASMTETLRSMRGFRNILVHEYGEVDDAIVYDRARHGREDFEAFREEILQELRRRA